EVPKRLARTRRLKRVGCAAPPLWLRKGISLLVSLILMVVFVALSALRKTAWARGFWKATVLRKLPGRKFLPRMVSVSPTESFLGAIDLTTGALGRPADPAAGERMRA